jgi:ABC-type transporter Mla subunit MlaD
MRRLIAIGSLVAAVAVIALAGTGAKDSSGTYEVRAIFDNAVSVIPGEDVKIAGVKVGSVSAIDVTSDQKAAITLGIEEPGFQDFRQDAQCTIRPQSLIGEKFVECTPTQPRAVGRPASQPLQQIKNGPGKGEYLLPVDRTSTPVDIDLINNILRRPYAERLSLIVNELGTGLAGRGADLKQVILRADPALKETDQVLAILARQNRVLANLATDSDQILTPLARDRAKVADFIVQSNTVAQATAERSAALEQDIQKLPAFLRELTPTMQRLGGFSDQATPVIADLGSQAPALNDFISQLGPFTRASLPALTTLGQAGKIAGPALTRARPTIRELTTFSQAARPLAANAAALLDSVQKTGGVERVMDYIFLQVAAINGFDQFGHYLRAGLIVNLCSTYATIPGSGCSANFPRTTGTAANASQLSAAGRQQLVRASAALAGNDTTGAKATDTKPALASVPGAAKGPTALRLPKIALPGMLGQLGQGTGATDNAATNTAGTATGGAGGSNNPATGLLDFLLGGNS